tara:strand:- start:202 stop:501 length:300 start_codon:yes stop_codon:yes gene_type:complete
MKLYENIPEDWENSHGWYYYADAIRYYSVNISKYKTEHGKTFTVKHCDKCNRQWQMKWISTKGIKYYDYYHDLPTYKMRRKICDKCLEKNKPTRKEENE